MLKLRRGTTSACPRGPADLREAHGDPQQAPLDHYLRERHETR
jgi:hypothetical protein